MWSETKEKESNLYLPKIAMLFGVAPSAKNNDFTARLRHLPSLFIFIFCAIYFQNGVILLLRANPSVCPRRRRRHVRTSKTLCFVGQNAHVHDHGFHLETHSLATCALTVATTTSSSTSSSSASSPSSSSPSPSPSSSSSSNPYWRSSMNVEV